MKKVIELIRVSTEAQAGDDRASLAAQRAVNRRTAQAYGLEIVDTIEVVDVSGAEVLASPEMQFLLERISNPLIEGVVAREFSRLMRPEKIDDFLLLGAFQKTKTVLYLPDGPLDFTRRDSRMIGVLKALIAGNEREELRERSMSAKEQMRREGKSPGSYLTWPHGVAYSKEKGWYFTPEAEQVRRIFKYVLAGEVSYSRIAEQVGMRRFNVA
jgi:DNA invertase Pin-like site-specific DNA recombinase